MSLIFDLDCLRPDNDKKIKFVYGKEKVRFWLKLRWFSITWTKKDIISECSKFKTDVENLAKDVEAEIQYQMKNGNAKNIGKIGILKKLYKILEQGDK